MIDIWGFLNHVYSWNVSFTLHFEFIDPIAVLIGMYVGIGIAFMIDYHRELHYRPRAELKPRRWLLPFLWLYWALRWYWSA